MNQDNINYKYMYQPCIIYKKRFWHWGFNTHYCTSVFRTEEEAIDHLGKFREHLIQNQMLHPVQYKNYRIITLKIKVA